MEAIALDHSPRTLEPTMHVHTHEIVLSALPCRHLNLPPSPVSPSSPDEHVHTHEVVVSTLPCGHLNLLPPLASPSSPDEVWDWKLNMYIVECVAHGRTVTSVGGGGWSVGRGWKPRVCYEVVGESSVLPITPESLAGPLCSALGVIRWNVYVTYCVTSRKDACVFKDFVRGSSSVCVYVLKFQWESPDCDSTLGT